MKRKLTLLSILFFFLINISNATVWRVNNRPGVDAHFTTLQSAIDGAASGDTLYVEGSTTSYGAGIFDKQLVVIGAGYWLAENDTTQAYKENSQVGRLTFNTGSENSVVEGLYIYDNQTNENAVGVFIYVDSIIVRRNSIRANQNYNHNTRAAYAVYISGIRAKIEILQNWIYASGAPSATKVGIQFNNYVSNSIIQNNFIRSSPSSYLNAIRMSVNNTANELIINNNVIWGNITTYYSIHLNNILVSGSYNNGTGDLTNNNLCNGTQYPNNGTNIQNVDMTTVFEDYTKYIDNGYFLATGSPAIGAGLNGGDCGAFGNGSGGYPYVLSGMPDIPAIFEATVTSMGTTSLPVNIKSKSNN